MKKRSAWIAALAAVLVIALVIGFWPGRSAQPTETTLGAVPELVVLPGEPGAASVAESAADGAAGALGTEPASGTAAAPGQTGAAETGKSAPAGETGKAAPAQKTFTPPIRNLLTESIGAPAPEIPAAQLITEPADVTDPGILEREDVSYDGEHFMVKLVLESDGTVTPALSAAGVTALEPMMRVDSGAWYLAYVGENGDVSAAVNAARAAEGVLTAEYDFVSQTMADMPMTEAVTENVRENPRVMEAWHLRACGIQQAWQYQAQNDLPVAGDGTIVAVIDTGVDYTHKELTASMWRNLNEIPDNGTDDDGNGYTDDYYGVDIVSGTGSGNDDHGHGTHVAGIIAAANNKEGTVGVAYNAKIMNIKAGQSSGYFNQSDVAKAIVYAYENGADVINMSFGGTASSLAVQDALVAAYTRCVLVAAAGNDGAPNEGLLAVPNYPAAFPYVLGVMSVSQNGVESRFTNWDVLAYNRVEYEVFAPGEMILSTIPGDRYAVWSGTSMASPVVASVAAMLRADLPDRGTYPTKFIYGQLAGTGTFTPACCDPEHHGGHNLPPVCDAIAALTVMPHPELGMSDYLIYDTESFAEKNNGDGVIDAGETVALGFTLRNRWGMSKDTSVTVDALSPTGIPCPYVTFSTDAATVGGDSAVIDYGSIGTYSEGDCGRLYSDSGDMVTGWEQPFYLHVSPDCPNDYCIALNVTIHAKNALDENDTTDYTASARVELLVRRGVILTGVCQQDMTLTAENYYIIPTGWRINEGVTVTVEPGTQIQFWCSDPEDAYAQNGIAYIDVRGTLLFNGTEEQPISLFPSAWMDRYVVKIREGGTAGRVEMRHCLVQNPFLEITRAENCEFSMNHSQNEWGNSAYLFDKYLDGTTVTTSTWSSATILIQSAEGCVFRNISQHVYSTGRRPFSHWTDCLFYDSYLNFSSSETGLGDGWRCNSNSYTPILDHCVFYRGENSAEEQQPIALGAQITDAKVLSTCYDAQTQTGYVLLERNDPYDEMLDRYYGVLGIADALNGHSIAIETEAEARLLYEDLMRHGSLGDGLTVFLSPFGRADGLRWLDGLEDGAPLPAFIRFGFNDKEEKETLDNLIREPNGETGLFLGLDDEDRFYTMILSGGDNYKFLIEIPDTTAEAMEPEAVRARLDTELCSGTLANFHDNVILNRLHDTSMKNWFTVRGLESNDYRCFGLAGNYWGTTDESLINKMIVDFDDYQTLWDIDASNFLTEPPEDVWPFVTDVEIRNQAGEIVKTVGNEPLKFIVCFNRDMDTSIDLAVRFGSSYPYADYEIDGRWTDARTWEGSTTLTTVIENGTQYLRIGNGRAADAPMKLYDDYGRFTFTIDTTAAQAMTMQGSADDNGILLTWYQDDFDTLAGYNVYRSTSEDGYYQRLNSSILPADVKEFYDDTVEPGQVYYYNFTVVKSDLSESAPSGKVTIMAKDTMAPVMYHTPVYQAFTGSNLIINATVTDNVAVQSVKLYYRQTGDTEWTVAVMNKLNDKYSAVISSALVTTKGLEYYIEATDGNTKVYRGTADAPYAVTVQEAVSLSDKGDVNGDGRITNLDALMLLQAVNDRLNLDAAQFARADINDDGELTAAEALRILHYVSGKITSVLF